MCDRWTAVPPSIPQTECYTARRIRFARPKQSGALPTGSKRRFYGDRRICVAGANAVSSDRLGNRHRRLFVLVAWRSVLTSHEDDQIFLDKAQDQWRKSSTNWSPRLISFQAHPDQRNHFRVLLLLIAGIFVYHGLKNF